MKLVIVIFLFSLSSAYASVGCKVRDYVEDNGPFLISKVLECKKVDPIREDLEYLLDQLNICKGELSTFKNDILCTVVAKYTVEKVESYIPEDWACRPEKLKSKSFAFIKERCLKILDSIFKD